MEITPRQLEIIEATGKILTTSGVSRSTDEKILLKKCSFLKVPFTGILKAKKKYFWWCCNIWIIIFTLIKSSLSETDDGKKICSMFFQKLSKFFNANPYFAVAVFSEGLLDENEKLNKEIMGLMWTCFTVIYNPLLPKGKISIYFYHPFQQVIWPWWSLQLSSLICLAGNSINSIRICWSASVKCARSYSRWWKNNPTQKLIPWTKTRTRFSLELQLIEFL